MFVTVTKAGTHHKTLKPYYHGQYLILAHDTHAEKEDGTVPVYGFVKHVASMIDLGGDDLHHIETSFIKGGKEHKLRGIYGNDSLPIAWENLTPEEQQQFVQLDNEDAHTFWSHGRERGQRLLEVGREILQHQNRRRKQMTYMDTTDMRVGRITKRRFAEMFEQLEGQHITLVHTGRGPVDLARTVGESKVTGVELQTDSGATSTLRFLPYELYFEIYDNRDENDPHYMIGVGDNNGIFVAYDVPKDVVDQS